MRRDEREGFGEVFAAHHRDAYRLAFLLCGDAAAAEDAVAEAFARVYPHWRAGSVQQVRPPFPAQSAVLAWAGDRLVVWGQLGPEGRTLTDTYAYDPAADRWTPLPRSPLRSHLGAVTAWSGSDLVVWAGTGRPDGARYRP